MKTAKVCSVIALCAALFTGLSAGCAMGGSDTGGTQTPVSQSNALEDALAASGDLSFSNADFTGLTATVSRTMVIKGASAAEPFDMKGSTLIITADGVTLRYLKNVNVVADEKLEEGSLNVTASQLNTFTVNGGGSSSIYVNDTAVTEAKIQKAGVHVVFTVSSSDVTIGAIEAAAPCNIESQAAAGKTLTVNTITVTSTDTVIQSSGEGNLALTSLDIGSTVSDITVGGCTITSLKVADTTNTTIAASENVTITGVSSGTAASDVKIVAASGTAVTTTGTAIPEPVTVKSVALTVGTGVKTAYVQNTAFDPTGLTVTVTYSDGSTKNSAVASSDLTGFDTSWVGEKTVTVSKYGLTAGTFTIQVTDREYLAQTAHVKVESDPDGIKFTLTKQTGDFDWGYVNVWPTTGSAGYDPVITGTESTFVFPLTEKGKRYYFKVLIEKYNDRHTTYTEYVTCTAGGGIGEVVSYNRAWKNAEEIRSEDGDHRYIQLSASEDLISIFTDKTHLNNICLTTEIATGPNDWGDKTEWLTISNAEPGSVLYSKIFGGTLDMMNADDGWLITPYEINAAITKAGSYFTNSYYKFWISSPETTGNFRTQIISSVTYLTYSPTAEKHITAEPCEDGVRFTITKQPGDFEWNNGGSIHEQGSDVWLSVNSFEGSTATVIYPLVEKGKSYTFDFYTEKKNNRHTSLYETLTCTAGGGIGNIVNYTDSVTYRDTKLALSDSGNGRIVRITLPSSQDTTLLRQSEVATVALHFDVASGTPDWGDTTEWVTGRKIDMSPEADTAGLKELTDGSDIFTSAWWNSAESKIEKLACNTTYFAQMNIEFTLAKYATIPGTFRLRSISSGTYAYHPVDAEALNLTKIENTDNGMTVTFPVTATTNDVSFSEQTSCINVYKTIIPAGSGTTVIAFPFTEKGKTYIFSAQRGGSADGDAYQENLQKTAVSGRGCPYTGSLAAVQSSDSITLKLSDAVLNDSGLTRENRGLTLFVKTGENAWTYCYTIQIDSTLYTQLTSTGITIQEASLTDLSMANNVTAAQALACIKSGDYFFNFETNFRITGDNSDYSYCKYITSCNSFSGN